MFEDKLNYLEHPIPAAPVPAHARQQVPPEALATHAAWVKGQKEIVRLMLMTMEPDIQRNLENLGAYDILQKLKTFAQQAEQELLQTVREFHACKQEEGQSVSSYVLKMKSYIDNLESLGHPVSLNVAVSLILVSLRKEYDSFVQNYNMHDMGKMVTELHAMLKLHEQTLPIRSGKVQKKINKNKKPPLEAELSPISIRVAKEQEAVSGSQYFSVVPRDGIYEIDLSNSNTNDSSMYAISNKRANLNLDSSLLWLCRLGHISKKRIEKLQYDGLFNSTDIQSFEKCISCMSGKMT
ncbi:zinc finger, CCHC-type containing protein [Tanacetum coccineum]